MTHSAETASKPDDAKPSPVECMDCGNDADNCICPCTYFGCEDGYHYGEDSPGFDYINDDPNEVYPCPSCRGTGLARKMTIW